MGAVGRQGRGAREEILDLRQLLLQPAGQDEQAHRLNEADVFFFDVMILRVRMEDPQGVLLRGEVVAQQDVGGIALIRLSDHGGDGVVAGIGTGDDAQSLIAVIAPGFKQLLHRVRKDLSAPAFQLQAGHRPPERPAPQALDAGIKAKPGAGAFHRENIAAALEMVMRQDGAAHDGQIGIGADKIVGKDIHKVEHRFKTSAVHQHGHMLAVEDDAVLVIVQVGGILQIPGPPRQLNGDDAVVLPGRETGPAGITGVLPAQGAFGVTHRRGQTCQGDIARVLLRL